MKSLSKLSLVLLSAVALFASTSVKSAGKFRARMVVNGVSPAVNDWFVSLRSSTAEPNFEGRFTGFALYVNANGALTTKDIEVGGYRPSAGERFTVKKVETMGLDTLVFAEGTRAPLVRTTTSCTANCSTDFPTIKNVCEAQPPSGGSWAPCDQVIWAGFAPSHEAAVGWRENSSSCDYTDVQWTSFPIVYSQSSTGPDYDNHASWDSGPATSSGDFCHMAYPKYFIFMDQAYPVYNGTVAASETYSTTVTSYLRRR
jgi:hypothetical protein